MKTIALHTQKGGAGKTSITGNVAYLISKKGYKVCMIDFDSSQGNLITWAWSEDNKKQPQFEIGDWLNCWNDKDRRGKENPQKKLENILFNVRQNLDILPTFGIESSLKSYITNKINNDSELLAIKELINKLESLGYDFVFFDLAPAMLTLEKRITCSIDEVILVTPASFFGMDGVIINNEESNNLVGLRKLIGSKPLIREKIILNSYDMRIKKNKEAKNQLEKSGVPFFVIRTSSYIDKLQHDNLFLGETEITHEVLNDYVQIVKIIIKEGING